jgi:uncharacterized SAM-binding protein YcdF (DUF218 family)
MFFYLSKLLFFVFNPAVWIVAILVWAVLTRNRKRKNAWFIAGAGLLILLTNPFLSDLAVGLWERPYRPINDIREPYDYGIVLGGMTDWDDEHRRVIFSEATDRLMQALDLYKTGKIRKIIISGGSGRILKPDENEALFLKDYLLRIGIPSADLLIEPLARNTRENALFVAKMLPKRNNSAILITSALHMRRAEGCFRKEGLRTLTWPTDRISSPGPLSFDPGETVIPSASALEKWNRLIHEIAGYAVYSVAGYL